MMLKKYLGKLEVSALGLGCMGMSEFYGPAETERSFETIHRAFDFGITMFDTADMYGFGRNEKLLGEAIKDFRDQVVIATKCGIVRKEDDSQFRMVNGKPEYVKKQCENSLKRLGLETIDLYYQHRVDPNTPIEETVGAMAELIQEGKIRHIGLSEATPKDIRKAHAVHPISALQTEYSLWNRDPEGEIFSVCQELGIGFVAYCPVGRGFLAGKFRALEALHAHDARRALPRFQDANFEYNLKIVDIIEEMAKKKGCTSSQLALAWIQHQNPSVVPLFGTTSPKHLEENIQSLQVALSKSELEELNKQVPHGFAKGERYAPQAMKAYNFTNRT